MGKVMIFVGQKIVLGPQGLVASTTKVGLAKLIGVSPRTVGSSLLRDGVVIDLKNNCWYVGKVELVKVGGNRGKAGGIEGFRGLKGKDGLLSSSAAGEN